MFSVNDASLRWFPWVTSGVGREDEYDQRRPTDREQTQPGERETGAVSKLPETLRVISDQREAAMEREYQRAMRGNYLRLGFELTIDFIVMYLVMYTMIATLAHLHINLNNVYMNLMMLAPMAVIMLVSMQSMFPSRRMNLAICAGVIVIFLVSFIGMRTQAGVVMPSSCVR
jgi:hypothetical protein